MPTQTFHNLKAPKKKNSLKPLPMNYLGQPMRTSTFKTSSNKHPFQEGLSINTLTIKTTCINTS